VFAPKRFVAKNLQRVSVPVYILIPTGHAPVYILIPTGHAVFIFLGLSFLKIHGQERGVIGEALIPLLTIAPRQGRLGRFVIAFKYAFENQVIFCTTVDGVFLNFKGGIGASLIEMLM
jgi:hypothetical protein